MKKAEHAASYGKFKRRSQCSSGSKWYSGAPSESSSGAHEAKKSSTPPSPTIKIIGSGALNFRHIHSMRDQSSVSSSTVELGLLLSSYSNPSFKLLGSAENCESFPFRCMMDAKQLELNNAISAARVQKSSTTSV